MILKFLASIGILNMLKFLALSNFLKLWLVEMLAREASFINIDTVVHWQIGSACNLNSAGKVPYYWNKGSIICEGVAKHSTGPTRPTGPTSADGKNQYHLAN